MFQHVVFVDTVFLGALTVKKSFGDLLQISCFTVLHPIYWFKFFVVQLCNGV
jgi:hypothetical protein